MKNIYAVGELLIDFVCSDVDSDLSKGDTFIKKAGGAPANVVATIAKFGGKSWFVGKVGADPFGTFLEQEVASVGVNTDYLFKDAHNATTMAFVSLQSDGERDFVFNRGADAKLAFEELDEEIFNREAIFHFGSATGFLGDTLSECYMKSIELASQRGSFISFDPNYREDLWRGSLDAFISFSKSVLSFADFAKFSEEELLLITGTPSIEAGVAKVHDMGVSSVAVTLGSKGSFFSTTEYALEVPSISVNSIDSTGAGDTFVGALLFLLSHESDIALFLKDKENVEKAVQFANCAAALVCIKHGAITAIPQYKTVMSYM